LKQSWILLGIAALAAVALVFFNKKQPPQQIYDTIEVDKTPPPADVNDYLQMSANGIPEPQFPSHAWMDFNDPTARVPEQELMF